MAAESPRRSRMGGPLVVAPQPPSDRSLMDTVSGFISDVTLASNPGADPKDAIQWARFEVADVNEPSPEGEGGSELSPLLLVVGYGSGVQVWLIPPNGDAQEVLSWRQGAVRLLRILPSPSGHDNYSAKRPLIGLCDSAGPGPPFCSLSFISLRGGDQVKSIKFKNPVLDVLANKRSIVVSFSERLAVFDACTLEDRLTVTTCYPSPCPLGSSFPANPISLGDRWLAYAERRLIPHKRSSGGCEGEGVSSYTATVLQAAKSLGKGLRGLGGSVASSLAGRAPPQPPSPPADQPQPGVVSVLDIESSPDDDIQDVCEEMYDPMVAHFVAHSDAIVALKFDSSGMLLVTADKRGHDFHVFRIHPHLSGPALASVHHLYILHRGDTTAKVQDIAVSADARWAAVATLRGTVHVFALSPYGGAAGLRTHSHSRVLNRLSRFHRSAGLTPDANPIGGARAHSPVGVGAGAGVTGESHGAPWFPNPRLPPYPSPCAAAPLAQLRPAPNAPASLPTNTITRTSSGRQRLSSLSEEGAPPLCVRCRWGAPPPPPLPRARPPRPAAAQPTPAPPGALALHVMSAHGLLLHYLLAPRPPIGIPKEKVCDDTPIELDVEVRSQWSLIRPLNSPDLIAPLPHGNPLLATSTNIKDYFGASSLEEEDRWLSQVEIVTHAGPHRRLWMGPQFVFKTYNMTTGSSLPLLDVEAVEAVEVGTAPALVPPTATATPLARSSPVNIRAHAHAHKPIVPVLIESGSASSLEHSPRMSDAYRKSAVNDGGINIHNAGEVLQPPQHGDVRLREDLAEAMKETDLGCELMGGAKGDPLRGHHVRRVVNPLGTVVSGNSSESGSPPSEDPDMYTHANEDESLFRPVVKAPKSIPPPCEMETQPLSTCTVIPAKRIQPRPSGDDRKRDSPTPLKSDVIIPAALSDAALDEEITNNITIEPSKNIKRIFKNRIERSDVIVENDKMKLSSESESNKQTQKSSEAVEQICFIEDNISNNAKSLPAKCQSNKRVDKLSNKSEIACDPKKLHSVHSKPQSNSPVKEISNDKPSSESMDVTNKETVKVAIKPDEPKSLSESNDNSLLNNDKVNVSETFTVTLPVPAKRNMKKSEVLDKPENIFEAIKTEEQAWELLSNEKTSNDLNSDLSKAAVELSKGKLNRKSRKNKIKMQSEVSIDSKMYDKSDGFDVILVKESSPEKQDVLGSSNIKSWSAIVGGSAKASNVTGSFPKFDEITSHISDSLPNKLASLSHLNDVVMAKCDIMKKELDFFDEHHGVFEEPPPLEPLNLTFEDKFTVDELFELEQELGETIDVIGNNEVDDEILSLKSTKDNSNESTANTYCDILKCNNLDMKDSFNEADNKSTLTAMSAEEIPKVTITRSDIKMERKFETVNVMDKSSDEDNISPSSSQTESDDCFPRLANDTSEEVAGTEILETLITTTVTASLQKSNKKKSKRKRR